MSENIPSTSTGGSPQNPNLLHRKKSRRRYDKTKLPTPPPDPVDLKSRDDREDFLAYLDSLQKSTSRSTFAPVIATEDAFDHLEKLYKLMEQMLELREQNARLHRRVRDLEHLNNLEKMHRELDPNRECPELEKDTAFAETILESILSEARLPRVKPKMSSRLRRSIKRARDRSGSVSCDKGEGDGGQDAGRRASTCVDSRGKSSAKVSKWTKVKAAFKWERASQTVSDAKSQDSGIGGMVPVNLEVARYLRVPSTCEDPNSPADSGAAEVSTPGSLSTASSTEDFNRHDLRIPCEDLRSSDEEHSHNNYIPHSKNGSQKSNKSHKTPWAKMKDIIQTRNSFKKKHRLSAQSDDIQIDVELCSDNEDVFEDEDKNRSVCSSPLSPRQVYQRVDSSELPPDIVERYQRAVISEDGTVSGAKKVSKWTRVKKAFLTPGESPRDVSTSPSRKISNVGSDEGKSVHAEIQRNYEQLQQKLSLEFQEKLNEWERMKQNSPGISGPSSVCGFVDDTKDPAFIKKMEEWQRIKSQPSIKNRPNIQMKSEEELPPEFRKKLEEWKKIRKNSGKESNSSPKKKLGEVPRWKSMSGHKTDNSPFEYSQLSEEFRKKLEEWKQIKSSGGTSPTIDEDKKKDLSKSTSPKSVRKNLSPKHSKKNPQDKELQWYERELGKIEKEKQRLERERQKFLEREERLSKLRNSVIGGLKKEVLIHTPSGFYRFEGISRKFTQKLYEWEKAQGIAPESSTFALLSSSLGQEGKANPKMSHSGTAASLVRSKSADSIAISALNLACPLMSHQPSSLSLNDVDDLEKECLADSKSSSVQFISRSNESLAEALDEPEALIVEVEDIVEETAAPLKTYAQRIQQPVYQRQELKTMCEGETLIGPKIRRSESARAQNSYNLIEEINNILRKITENELEIQRAQDAIVENMDSNKRDNENVSKLKTYDDSQKATSNHLNIKITKLQEENTSVASNLNRGEPENANAHMIEAFDLVQDLSNEIFQLGEKLESEVKNRNVYTFRESGARSLTPIMEIIKDLQSKMLKLRRALSYVCAASDVTTPRRKRSSKKKPAKKTVSNESKESRTDPESSSSKTEKPRLYIKSETGNNTQSQGAVKKRIRYRQKSSQNRSVPDTDEEDESVELKRNPHKKLTRTRSVSESSAGKAKTEEVVMDESVIQKIVVPTKTNFVDSISNTAISEKPTDSPVTVFVKTTRKLFTPLIESAISSKNAEPVQPVIDNNLQQNVIENSSSSDTISEKTINGKITSSAVARLPPLPSSPTIQRKFKDISPSIRVMLAKYNQKITGQDLIIPNKSAGSSGSASPVAWRSPTSERRVKAQTERYQEELDKLSPLMTRREVQKSASVGYLQAIRRKNSVDKNDIAKSSSVSVFHNRLGFQNDKSDSSPRNITERKTSSLRVVDQEVKMRHSPEIRLRKLQQAKEEFLKSCPSAPPLTSQPIKFPTRNRLSQISVGSESSYDSACASGALIKSASAGMINIDADTYRQIDPEIHDRGYVSLPRSTKKSGLGGKFAFSNIASKFRKVKMRRGKDKDKDSAGGNKSAISALCRQSLVVDITKSPIRNRHFSENSPTSAESIMEIGSSEDVSSSSSKTGSWIRKPKLFRKN